MRYKFFANSQKSWKAMFDAIYSAKKTIYIEMYIFQSNIREYNFFDLLKEKAENGVKIKMVLDSYGSASLHKDEIATLRNAGIELLFLSYFFHRTHRKIIIIDQELAFIGGVNIYEDSSLWNDLVVRVRGKLVQSIIRSFSKVYIECGGKDTDVTEHYQNKPKRKMRDWLVEHFPTKKEFEFKKVYREHISQAKKHVIIVTPYLSPKRWLVSLLHQAYLKGVKVEILIPRDTDSKIVNRLNYFYINKMRNLGITFFLENKMNHAKIMMIDSQEAIVGSQNLDFFSFEMNHEVGIFFQNMEAIGRINRIINEWKKDAKLFEKHDYKKDWIDYIIVPIFRLLVRII